MGVGGKDHFLATLRAGKSPCANSSGGWVDPRTGLERSEKLRLPPLYSTPGPSSPQETRYTNHAMPAYFTVST
jgi:hypothetical protein